DQERMIKVVAAAVNKEVSVRVAANAFGVEKSSVHRHVKKHIPMNAKPGPDPVLTEGEAQGIIDDVKARTKRGQCFTSVELGKFVR
ncbi:hypothetical protein PHYSODRAFT_407691, partial [Phytophthora sojae]